VDECPVFIFSSIKAFPVQRTISTNFRSQFLARRMEQPSNMLCSLDLAWIAIKLDAGGKSRSWFYLHFFSAPSKHFLQKELINSKIQLPGGPHGTSIFNAPLL
jgi:hypothetical protein